jgi:hypothetical protein
MLIPATTEQFIRIRDDAKEERRRLKAIERNAEDRVLDPWERYRALNDHCERLHDLTELYDRKTRFALLILGGLNALNLLMVARADVLTPLRQGSPLVIVYGGCYVLLSIGLLFYAISALKPRMPRDPGETPDTGEERPRLLDGELQQMAGEYCARWRDAQIGEINRELAMMAFMRAQVNATKIRAVDRVYSGLYILVGVTALLSVGVALLQ